MTAAVAGYSGLSDGKEMVDIDTDESGRGSEQCFGVFSTETFIHLLASRSVHFGPPVVGCVDAGNRPHATCVL